MRIGIDLKYTFHAFFFFYQRPCVASILKENGPNLINPSVHGHPAGVRKELGPRVPSPRSARRQRHGIDETPRSTQRGHVSRRSQKDDAGRRRRR